MTKRVTIVLMCMLLTIVSEAATRKNTSLTPPRYKGSAPVTHWLGLSLNGVEADMLPDGTEIKTKFGGGGGGHLLYELNAKGWFVNIGVGADYMITNIWMGAYTDAFARVDRMGEALTYRYQFSDLSEQQRQLRVVVPLQIGYQSEDMWYVGVGAAFRTAPLINTIGSKAQMYAQGEYDRFIEPIRETPYYGFWARDTYTGQGVMLSATNEVALEAEARVNIPMPMQVIKMRAGVFVGYDLPLTKYEARSSSPLVDYSAVNTNPLTQTQENVKQNIRFGSMLDTSLAAHDAHRLRVGVRLTVLFDITPKPKHCMCWK